MRFKKEFFFHLLGFLFVFILIIYFSFYQLFFNFNFVSYFKSWPYNSKALVKELALHFKKIKVQEVLPKTFVYTKSQELLVDDVNSKKAQKLSDLEGFKVFECRESSDKFLACVLKKDALFKLKIFSLVDLRLILEKDLEEKKAVGLAGWSDNEVIYLSFKGKDDKWQIVSLDLNNEEEFEILISDINFPKEKLTASLGKIKDKIVYPWCDDACYFSIFNLNEKKAEVDKIDIPQIQISNNISFYYFSQSFDRIIYEALDKRDVYVIDFKGELWHRISLTDDANRFILFKGLNYNLNNLYLLAYSEQRNEAYIYDLIYYGLKIVELDDCFSPAEYQVNNFTDDLLLKDKCRSGFLLKDLQTGENTDLVKEADYFKFF
jgi:hypothetical protein